MANNQSHDTRGNSSNRLAQAVGLSVAARTAVVSPPTSFVPMYKEDFAVGTVGTTNPAWRYSEYSNVRSVSGTQSTRMGANRGSGSPTCGGNVFFGNNQSMNEPEGLPEGIPIGSTVWYRVFFYFASTYSFGYVFRSGQDNAEASGCGKSADMGNTGNKWMNFDSPGTSGKVYIKIPSSRRKAAQPSGDDPERKTIIIENEAGSAGTTSSGMSVPLDRWFSMQLGMKVSRDNTGWVRLWIDNELEAEQLNVNTIQAGDTAITNWGIGDWWNGVPWTDGSPGEDDLWLDEIIIASDMPGYGAPTGVDAAGNAYIDPATRVGDL